MYILIFCLAGGLAVWFYKLSNAASPRQSEHHDEAGSESISQSEAKRLAPLKRKTLTLANQIFDFVAEAKKNEPPMGTQEEAAAWAKKPFDEEAFSKAFTAAGEARFRYSDRIAVQFAQRFAGRAKKIRDDLSAEGFESVELDKRLKDDLRFDWDMRIIAEELQRMANQISD